MQTRHYWLGLCLSTSIFSANFAQAAAKEWSFDVYLDKSKIGLHRFKLSDRNQLVSEANFQVKFLLINAYQYQHTSKEQWNNDCLNELDANTKENKILSSVSGHLANGQFSLSSNVNEDKKMQSLPECVMTFAYWNPKILRQTRLLNPQNGDYLYTTFRLIGNEKIDFNGEQKNAKHYHLLAYEAESMSDKPKLNIQLWYDNNNDWLALKSITPEGYTISYKRK